MDLVASEIEAIIAVLLRIRLFYSRFSAGLCI